MDLFWIVRGKTFCATIPGVSVYWGLESIDGGSGPPSQQLSLFLARQLGPWTLPFPAEVLPCMLPVSVA